MKIWFLDDGLVLVFLFVYFMNNVEFSFDFRVNGSVGGGGGAVSRSLPDLPVGPSSAQDNTGDGYPDTTSDLYATLDLGNIFFHTIN